MWQVHMGFAVHDSCDMVANLEFSCPVSLPDSNQVYAARVAVHRASLLTT